MKKLNTKTTLPYLTLALLLLLSACGNNSYKPKDPFERTSEEVMTREKMEEELAEDKIMQEENVEKACASICNDLTQATEQLNRVNSPTSIIKAKREYLNVLSSLKNDINQLSDADKKVVQTYQAKAEEAYNKACNTYEVPASGVIANLKSLIDNIDKVKTQRDMKHFEENRLGTLRNLDDIHLCIEHNSQQIPEVKRLAQTLKSKYEAKKHEVGLQ